MSLGQLPPALIQADKAAWGEGQERAGEEGGAWDPLVPIAPTHRKHFFWTASAAWRVC